MQFEKNNRKYSLSIIIFCLILLVIISFFYYNLPPIDDALIIERYFRNFREGYGIYFNPNESLNYGYTSILGTWINALISVLFSLDIFTLRFILPSLTFIFIFFINLKFIFKENLLFSIIPIISPLFLYWSYSGVESFWIVFFIYLSSYFTKKKKYNLLSITIGSSFLFRPEMIFCSAPFYIFFMRNISKKYSLGEKFISLSLLFLPLIISIFIISNNYENIIPLSIIAKSFNNDISYISFFKTLIKNSIGSFDNKYLTFSYYLLILLAFITSFDYLKNRKIKSDKSTPINLISL